MTGLETKKERIIFCLGTGIAGACIATACFYVAGASFAVLFAGKMTAKALMTAGGMWLEFFALAFVVSTGYACAVLRSRKKTEGRVDLSKADVLIDEEKETAPQEEEKWNDFITDFLDHDIDAILKSDGEMDELLDEWVEEFLEGESSEECPDGQELSDAIIKKEGKEV